MPSTFQRDIQDYLDASGDASKRTRTATIILVVATVIVFAGLLNSQQTNWMHSRLLNLADERGTYVESKLGKYPQRNSFPNDDSYRKAAESYHQRYVVFWEAVARTYVDNSWVIRVPFLGFTFDVNDLGLLGGIGLLVVFVCYRFFLTREVDNLRLSFEEARRIGKAELEEFYKLLAMRQVFTIPHTPDIKRTRFLLVTPKLICWFPVVVYLVVTYNDLSTSWIGKTLQLRRYQLLILFEVIVLAFLIVLAFMVTKRLVRMDGLWDECWQEIQTKPELNLPDSQAGKTPSAPPSSTSPS
jgi:hypothetical protein